MTCGSLDTSLVRAALECDRPAGGVEGALERLLAAVLDATGAACAGVDALDAEGRPEPAARTADAPDQAPALAITALQEPPSGLRSSRESGDLAVVAVWDGEPRGVLWTSRPAEDGSDLLEAGLEDVATRAGGLLEHRRTLQQLDRAIVSGVAAEERMLGRIGLDIHDGPTQQMSVALLEVQLLQAEVEDATTAGATLPDALEPGLLRIYETLGGALHELRELIGTLRPAQFQSRSLEVIVRETVRGFEARTDIRVPLRTVGSTDVPGITLTQRITFFRILQEALTNAHRHGRARSVLVRLVAEPDATMLQIADDGHGFDPDALAERAEASRTRIGLAGMRDRADLLGGTCTVESAPGAGTTVTVSIPRWHGGAER